MKMKNVIMEKFKIKKIRKQFEKSLVFKEQIKKNKNGDYYYPLIQGAYKAYLRIYASKK